MIAQCKASIEFLWKQVQDFTLELRDIIAHTDILHKQAILPITPNGPEDDEEEAPEEIKPEDILVIQKNTGIFPDN